MERLPYLDFELEIGPGSGREYPVVVVRSEAGEARETMRFPFGELELENRLKDLQIALLRSGRKRRRMPSQEEQTVQDFGQKLFDALLTGEVRSRYDVSQLRATQQSKGLRLKLRIQSPELAALPWEFLYDSRQAEYICLSRHTPVVRYLELPQPIQPLTVTPPLRILGMIASPRDLPPLNITNEKQRVEEAIKDLRRSGLIELTWLEGQTWRDLQRTMRSGPWHVLHFIGHGGFDRNTDEGLIALADEEGKTQDLSATLLGRLLADHRSLRLVLLNSCEGARGSERDIFSSTAAILVRRGIPAVLAMQYEITDRAAIEFARAFYEALAEEMPADAAVAEARKAVSLSVANTVEWGTPVLYMRSPDGVLFSIEEQDRIGKKPAEAEQLKKKRRERKAREEAKQLEQVRREREEQAKAARDKTEHKRAIQEQVALLLQVLCVLQERKAREEAMRRETEQRTKAEAERKAHEKPAAEDTPIKPQIALLGVRQLVGHTKQVNSVTFSPDGAILASGSGGTWGRGDDTVRLWSVSDSKILRTLEGHKNQVHNVIFSPDGKMLVSASLDNVVWLWRVSDGARLPTFEGRVLGNTIALSPDGRTLASGRSFSDEKTVKLWRISDGEHLSTLEASEAEFVLEKSVVFSPDGVTLAAVSMRTVFLWRVSDGEILRTFKVSEEERGATSITFSPDGKILASGASSVWLWRVSDGKLLHRLEDQDIIDKDELLRGVNSVAFSPDGAIVASGSDDKMVRLWRVPDGKLLHRLEGHKKKVNSVAFSPDGATLASGSDDQTIRLWKLR